MQDYVAWLHLCSQHQVKLATPSRILDPVQHSDWMLLLMEGGFSSVEMKVLQARMAEGRVEAYRAGKYLAGNPPIPYRYDGGIGGLVVLTRVPVRVMEGSDRDLREISLVENIQREDLSPLEIASAITELIQHHTLTQEEVAERIGWSRAAVTNKLRLLQLPEEVRNMLSESLLSEGHCRALLSVDSPSMMIALARTAEERGMSVRQLEEAVRRSKLQVPEVSSAKRASFVIPEPVQSSLRGQGISLKVTGNPNRMKVSLDGLNRSQMEAFVRFLEERGEELFPGK